MEFSLSMEQQLVIALSRGYMQIHILNMDLSLLGILFIWKKKLCL